jgi:hypothetical protein
MSNQRIIQPGLALHRYGTGETALYASPAGLRVRTLAGQPSLEVSYPELSTLISEYFTLVPVEAPKPRPERWIVDIEDVLRPWEKIDPLGPFAAADEAIKTAKARAIKMAEPTHCLRFVCRGTYIEVSDGHTEVEHYRLTWRQEATP